MTKQAIDALAEQMRLPKWEREENKRFARRHRRWLEPEPKSLIPSTWPAFEQAMKKWGFYSGIFIPPPSRKKGRTTWN